VRKIFGRRAAAPFEQEATGRGGPEGWAPRGCSAGERERERGGGGCGGGSSGGRHQPPAGGRGAAALWCTGEGDGGAGDVSDATDRRGWVTRGARWQRLGAGVE
jgi:hypothetical protein